MTRVTTTTMPHSRVKETTRWLALGAVPGPVLFTLASFALVPLHHGYSSVSRPVSALAIGPDGGFMRAAFLLYGVLVTVGLIAVFTCLRGELGAVARWACTALLALSPHGILWAGIFTMDTLTLHNIGMQAAIATPVITLPIVGLILRGAPSWRRFGTLMLLGGPLMLALPIGFIKSVPVSEMVTGAGAMACGGAPWASRFSRGLRSWVGWRSAAQGPPSPEPTDRLYCQT